MAEAISMAGCVTLTLLARIVNTLCSWVPCAALSPCMTDLCNRWAAVRVLLTARSCAPTSIPPLLALFSAPAACDLRQHEAVHIDTGMLLNSCTNLLLRSKLALMA